MYCSGLSHFHAHVWGHHYSFLHLLVNCTLSSLAKSRNQCCKLSLKSPEVDNKIFTIYNLQLTSFFINTQMLVSVAQHTEPEYPTTNNIITHTLYIYTTAISTSIDGNNQIITGKSDFFSVSGLRKRKKKNCGAKFCAVLLHILHNKKNQLTDSVLTSSAMILLNVQSCMHC